MSINVDNDKNIPIDTHAYYEYCEELASQEELYLEETEEEVRAILAAYDPSTSQDNRAIVIEICEERVLDLQVKRSITDDPVIVGSLDEGLVGAVEELIAGDSDDPPLSEKAAFEMLRITKI